MRTIFLNIICVMFLSASYQTAALQNNQYSDTTQKILNRLQYQIDASLYAIAEERKKSSESMKGFYFAVEKPASETTNLGVVLDTSHASKGFEVLTVTPNSIAELNGLKTGDRIVEISGHRISESNKQKMFDSLLGLESGTKLSMSVLNNDGEQHLNMPITGNYRPSIKIEIGQQSIQVAQVEDNKQSEDSSCGEISVFFSPPVTKDLHSAFVNSIDGDGVLRNRQTFRLAPGKHIIKLHELISSRENIRRSGGIQKSKPLEIEIEKNVTYHLAAKFNRLKRFKTRKGEYWEPVIWRTKKKANDCEL
ncbi:MAG: hypothetical protein COB38_05845 [Gammaproteobacteria bacterium]|nr:MAG: hypothetical protein COB38_05845 [Gammaproteobacteria bacterium]